jgi:hypothetical protein
MRPTLEQTNPELAARAIELAVQQGIKHAARATGLSKNTVKALLTRLNLMWAARAGAVRRASLREVSGWLADVARIERMAQRAGCGKSALSSVCVAAHTARMANAIIHHSRPAVTAHPTPV